jgi:hypothetical protein
VCSRMNGGSSNWSRGREWGGFIVLRVCLEWYQTPSEDIMCSSKRLPCECKNILWCLGGGLSSGTVVPALPRTYSFNVAVK